MYRNKDKQSKPTTIQASLLEMLTSDDKLDIEAVELLLKKNKVDLNKLVGYVGTEIPMFWYGFSNHPNNIKLFELLIKNGANINATANSGETLLHVACNEDELSISFIETLLKNGATPNTQNNDKDSPLKCIIKKIRNNSTISIIKLLLKFDADPNLRDSKNISAFQYACDLHMDNLIVIDLFLKNKNRPVDLNHSDKDGRTLLNNFCSSDSINISLVEMLLENGADSNIPDNNGRIPLHHVLKSKEKSIDLINLLLKYMDRLKSINASEKAMAPFDITLDSIYPSEKELAIIDMLLDRGIDMCDITIDECKIDAVFLLELCYNFCKNLFLIKFFFEKIVGQKIEFNVNEKDSKGKTLLHYFCQHTSLKHSYLKFIKILIERETELDSKDNKQKTPLMLAGRKMESECDFAVINLLIEKGADFNIKNDINEPMSAVQRIAYHCGQLQTIKLLIEKGFDPKTIPQESLNYLLGQACIKGQRTEFIKFLLEQGANPNYVINALQFEKNIENKPLIEYLCEENKLEIILTVLSWSAPAVPNEKKQESYSAEVIKLLNNPEESRWNHIKGDLDNNFNKTSHSFRDMVFTLFAINKFHIEPRLKLPKPVLFKVIGEVVNADAQSTPFRH